MRFFGAFFVVVVAVACAGPAADPEGSLELARRRRSTNGVEHIVVLTMENRSFDHFLGWVPGADGLQAGLTYPDPSGGLQATHELAPDFQGCSFGDPDHSYSGGRAEFDGGRADGWLFVNDAFSIGYYTQADLAFWSRAVPLWTTLDHYHPAILSETIPNRIYLHAGQTDRIANTFSISHLPTIWDRLSAAGLRARYYFSDVPFVALWGFRYLGISRLISSFYADAAAGTLPAVSYLDGHYLQELIGTGDDDHPHQDVRNGEQLIARVHDAIVSSPQWSSTVLIVNFDEWGGFYDHVPPPTAAIPPATLAAGDTDGRLGFRVPAMLVSPFAPNKVGHGLYDHTSVLRFIESTFGLAPLTVRDANANNLADELDFSSARAAPKPFKLPSVHYGVPCFSSGPFQQVNGLQQLARQYGFPAP